MESHWHAPLMFKDIKESPQLLKHVHVAIASWNHAAMLVTYYRNGQFHTIWVILTHSPSSHPVPMATPYPCPVDGGNVMMLMISDSVDVFSCTMFHVANRGVWVPWGPDCHLHMRRLRHLRMPTSLVHARASTTSLVHAHTFWTFGWGGWDDNVPWTCTHTRVRVVGG